MRLRFIPAWYVDFIPIGLYKTEQHHPHPNWNNFPSVAAELPRPIVAIGIDYCGHTKKSVRML